MNGKVPVICLLVCHVNTKHKDSMEVSLELRDVKMQYSHDLEVRKTRKIRQSQNASASDFLFSLILQSITKHFKHKFAFSASGDLFFMAC